MVYRWKPNVNHTALMQLFHINWSTGGSPMFGQALVKLDGQESEGIDGLYTPTMEAVIKHFDMLKELRDKSSLWKQLDRSPLAMKYTREGVYRDFYYKTLLPTRVHLRRERFLYMYNLPPIHISIQENNRRSQLVSSGTQQIQVIPESVEIARGYHVHEDEIKNLAPSALYILTKKLAAYGSIRSEERLLACIDGWTRIYNNPILIEQVREELDRSIPCVTKSKHVQRLLTPRVSLFDMIDESKHAIEGKGD